jgi:hypothetical protein
VQPEHGALDLRHLDAGEVHRRRHGEGGGDTWFFLTADYAFGHALERDTTNFVRANGGRVLGSVRTPVPGHDGLLVLPGAGAGQPRQVIGLANAGADTINSIKQAASSGSPGAAPSWPLCSCSSTTCTAWGCKRRRT